MSTYRSHPMADGGVFIPATRRKWSREPAPNPFGSRRETLEVVKRLAKKSLAQRVQEGIQLSRETREAQAT